MAQGPTGFQQEKEQEPDMKERQCGTMSMAEGSNKKSLHDVAWHSREERCSSAWTVQWEGV